MISRFICTEGILKKMIDASVGSTWPVRVAISVAAPAPACVFSTLAEHSDVATTVETAPRVETQMQPLCRGDVYFKKVVYRCT